MRILASIFFLSLLALGGLHAQEFCRDILTEAATAYKSDNLNLALSRLKAVETCDYKNLLIRERLEVQDSIFARITRQREIAEKERNRAENALEEAQKARDAEEKAKEQALASEAIAIAERNRADSARVAAEKATRNALVNDLAFKADKAPNRSTAFRLLELANRIDPDNGRVRELLADNYFSDNRFYAFRLTGHRGAVRFIAFSENGEKLVSAASGEIMTWAVAGQQTTGKIETNDLGAETIAAYAPKTGLFAGAKGKQVTIWSLPAMNKLYSIPLHSDRISALAFSADGNKLAYAGVDGAIKIWDLPARAEELALAGHSSNVLALAFSSDGRQLVSGSLEDIIIWNLADGSRAGALTGHTQAVNAVAFSPDNSRIASASADNSLKVWSVNTRQPILTLLGHTDEVSGVRFSPDGSRLISASYDQTARIWDAQTGRLLHTLQGHSGWLGAAVFSPDGKKAATCAADGEITVWDLAAGPDGFSIAWAPKKIRGLSLSTDHSIALAATDKEIVVWDMEGRKEWRRIQAEERSASGKLLNTTSEIYSAALSPDGKTALTASNVIRCWDLTSGQESFTLTGHKGNINFVDFFAEGSRIISASDDGTVKIWDAAGKRALVSFSGPSGHNAISAMASRDGSKVIALFEFGQGQADRGQSSERNFDPSLFSGEVIVWDVQEKKKVFSSRGLILGDVELTSAAISPDGSKIAIGTGISGEFGSLVAGVNIWNIAKRKPRLLLRDTLFGGKITTLGFSPDGNEIVFGGSEGYGGYSNGLETEGYFPLNRRGPAFLSIFFSNDGRQIIGLTEDGGIRIWDKKEMAGGRDDGALLPLPVHRSEVVAAALSPDGTLLASASTRKEGIMIWNMDDGSLANNITGLSDKVNSIAFSPDGKNIAALSGSEVKVWSLDGKMEPVTTTGSRFAEFSPDGSQLACGDGNGLKIWNWASPAGDSIIFAGHTGPINHAAFSPDGTLIASASSDNTVRLWLLVNGPAGAASLNFPDEVVQVAFSPDSHLMATLSGDSIRVWAADGLQQLFSAEGKDFIRFSPDGKNLITGNEEGGLLILNLRTGKGIQNKPTGQLLSAFFHPNPKYQQLILISKDGDKTMARTQFLDAKGLIAKAEDNYQIDELLPDQIREYGLETGFPYAGILDANGMPTPLIGESKPIRMERYRDYFAEQTKKTADKAEKERYQKIITALDEALAQFDQGSR